MFTRDLYHLLPMTADVPLINEISKIWQNITTSERSLHVQCVKATVNDNTFTKVAWYTQGGSKEDA